MFINYYSRFPHGVHMITTIHDATKHFCMIGKQSNQPLDTAVSRAMIKLGISVGQLWNDGISVKIYICRLKYQVFQPNYDPYNQPHETKAFWCRYRHWSKYHDFPLGWLKYNPATQPNAAKHHRTIRWMILSLHAAVSRAVVRLGISEIQRWKKCLSVEMQTLAKVSWFPAKVMLLQPLRCLPPGAARR